MCIGSTLSIQQWSHYVDCFRDLKWYHVLSFLVLPSSKPGEGVYGYQHLIKSLGFPIAQLSCHHISRPSILVKPSRSVPVKQD